MSTRSRMVRRATIERNTASGLDPYNMPIPPLWTPLAEPVPCWVWSRVKQMAVDNVGVMLIEDILALFPSGADVQQGDRVTNLTDRLGVIKWAGPLIVEEIVVRPDHLEAHLQKVE